MFHFNSIIVFCDFFFYKKSSEKCKYVIKDNLVPICKKRPCKVACNGFVNTSSYKSLLLDGNQQVG